MPCDQTTTVVLLFTTQVVEVLQIGEDRIITDCTVQVQDAVCLVRADAVFCQNGTFAIAKIGMSNSDGLAIE